MNEINLIYFSPTSTTKKILNAIGQGGGADELSICDVTFDEERKSFSHSDFVVFGVPVYSGRIPEIFHSRIKHIKGDNTPAAVVAVYGNRDYDDALLELEETVKLKGFNVISAAAFIGEHSFSCSSFPIAELRPDKGDLHIARKYGEKLVKNIADPINKDHQLQLPGNRPYKERSPHVSVSPETDIVMCNNCLKCVDVCPTGAISTKDPTTTDSESCIKCCACIKVCTSKARSFRDPRITGIAERLFNSCKEKKEPDLIF